MGKPLIIRRNWFYRWIRRPNVFYSMCNCCEATTTANGRFFTKMHFTMENLKFWGSVKWGLKIFAPNYQKAHPYAKSGSNKSFGVCGSDVVLTLSAARKKVRENRHWKLDVVYNTTSLPRRRDCKQETHEESMWFVNGQMTAHCITSTNAIKVTNKTQYMRNNTVQYMSSNNILHGSWVNIRWKCKVVGSLNVIGMR